MTSFVLPCYILNEELLKLTKEAIYSFRQADEGAELIVIDDGSPLGSGFLKSVADVFVGFKENQGFIRACNSGLALTEADFVAVVNNDIRVSPNIFEVAIEIFKQYPDVYSVHPRMTEYEEPFVYGDKVYVTGKERWCQSSCFVVRAKPGIYSFPWHFQGTGGGYEDWYLWSYVRRAGWKTAYTDKACFNHKGSFTTKLLGEESKRHSTNAKLFKDEFGYFPEDYYIKLYPDQMAADWLEGFKLNA